MIYIGDIRADEGLRIRDDGMCPCLHRVGGGLLTNVPVIVVHEGRTIRARRLTPKECFRLQGFPDEYFERAAAAVPERELYSQAGNSVTVNVIYEIAKRLK